MVTRPRARPFREACGFQSFVQGLLAALYVPGTVPDPGECCGVRKRPHEAHRMEEVRLA